jgi:hypothetical protein
VWNTLGVLNYLQALVGKSGIVEELTAPGEKATPDSQYLIL